MEVESGNEPLNMNKSVKNEFPFDYKGQNLSNNANYIKWENEMIKDYGRDAKLFKCFEDKILFYVPNKDTKGNHLHLGKCPQCQKFICFFCSRKGGIDDKAYCCVSRKLRYILFNQELDRHIDCVENSGTFMPIISFMLIMGIFSRGFYYRLYISERLYEKKKKEHNYGGLITYERNISKKMFIPIVALNIILAFFLSIPFIILNIEFIIIFALFNVILFLRPLRYLSSMIRFDI